MDTLFPMLLDAAVALLLGGSALSMYRIIAGPSPADRMVGLNMVAGQVLALLVVFAVREESPVYLDVALVYAVFGFVGLLALSRVMRAKEDDS